MYQSLATPAGDVISPAKGKTQISTKEGALLELSDNDDVLAGPGIAGGGGSSGAVLVGIAMGISTTNFMLRQVLNQDLEIRNALVAAIDQSSKEVGKQAGKSFVQGTLGAST